MANTKIPSEFIPDDAITSAHVADDAITAAHIDSTATGITFADITVDTSTLKVDATNNRVIIGHTSGASGDFVISNGGAENFEFFAGNTSDVNVIQHYNRSSSQYVDNKQIANNHIFASGGTEVFRTSSTFLGVGTDSPFTRLHVKGTNWSSGSPYGSMALIEGNNTNDNNWGHLHITDTTTANGNGGSIRFGTGAASALNPFSGIQGVAEGTSHGGLGFYTRPSGGTSTERMRIKSDGTVGVGTDSPSNQFTIYRSGSETTASLHSNGQSELRFVANNAANTWIQAGTGPSSSQVIINLTGMYGTSNTMTIDTPNARVGINTSSPSSKLHVASGAQNDYSYYQTCGQGTYYHGFGNSFYFHHFQSGASAGFYWGSACVANGGFSSYSDERLKENITTIDNALDKVALMDGITFTWKDTEKRGSDKQFGVTAQNMLEVDSALPVLQGDAEATQEDIDNPDVNTDFYTFDYARLTPYFIEAIKELKTKLEAAEARITELEG